MNSLYIGLKAALTNLGTGQQCSLFPRCNSPENCKSTNAAITLVGYETYYFYFPVPAVGFIKQMLI